MPQISQAVRKMKRRVYENTARYPNVFRHWSEYGKGDNWKPFSVAETLAEMRSYHIPFGLEPDGTFWYDTENFYLTPGLQASIERHRESLAWEIALETADTR